MQTELVHLHAREVLDSRGRPTVEVEAACAGGGLARAIVPSGASTGAAEACELRDGDATRYDGDGVLRAVANVERVLKPAILGRDASDQAGLDALLIELDGTPQKTALGANAVLGVSLVCAHAAAAAQGVALYEHLHGLYHAQAAAAGKADLAPAAPRMPVPMTNMISGGLHAGGNLDFQDFLVSPDGAHDYRQGLEWIVRVYRRLGRLLAEKGYEGRLVGDEGGFGPRLRNAREALTLVVQAIEAAHLRPGAEMTIALDVAATHFYSDGRYKLRDAGSEGLSGKKMGDALAGLIDEFPVTSLEDPLAEDDWDGWRALTEQLGGRVRLVGDDLFATNPARIRRGVQAGVANAALIKLNQIGTLSETMVAMLAAREGGYACVVSARSGETEDDTIADLAVATAADAIKIGSITRSERLAKYNRLLRIEEKLAAVGGPGEAGPRGAFRSIAWGEIVQGAKLRRLRKLLAIEGFFIHDRLLRR